jgi:polyisoprenoid-binding protein YceI
MLLNENTKWSIDQDHCSINFKIRHLMIAYIRGSFKKFDASIYITNNDFTTAEIDFWIGADSIDTGNAERDNHLRSADFFDVAAFPQISFVSTTIGRQNEKGIHELWGELTIKGISKAIKLDVEFGGIVNDAQGNSKSGFLVEGKINRSDWGIIFNAPLEIGGVMVGEDVRISCEIELIAGNKNEMRVKPDRKTDNNYVM